MAYTLLGKAAIEGHLTKWDRSSSISDIFKTKNYSLPVPNGIWADDTWKGKNQWEWKVVQQNYVKLGAKYNKPTTKKFFHIEVSGITIKIEKTSFKAGTVKSKQAGGRSETKMQEDASMHIMAHALTKRGKAWSSMAKFLADEDVDALLETYYPMGAATSEKKWNEWRETYYKQAVKILSITKIKDEKWTKFSRDEGFMQWITDLIRKRFKISAKDTWNPADIWLINNERETMKYIEDTIGEVGTVEQLNIAMRNLFNLNLTPEFSVMGISLKKISGGAASWQVYNMTTEDGKRVANSFSPEDTLYPISRITMGLHMAKTPTSTEEMIQVYSEVYIGDPSKGDNIKIQVGRHAIGSGNMKFEGSSPGEAAKLGKCPVETAAKIFSLHGIRHDRSYRSFPQTEDEFMAKRSDYERMLKLLKLQKVVTFSDPRTADTLDVAGALSNLQAQFNIKDDPGRANTKCQQIDLLSKMFGPGMTQARRERIWTDIALHGQKIGDEYGPFGKLY